VINRKLVYVRWIAVTVVGLVTIDTVAAVAEALDDGESL
jgi:hypothetical protein